MGELLVTFTNRIDYMYPLLSIPSILFLGSTEYFQMNAAHSKLLL